MRLLTRMALSDQQHLRHYLEPLRMEYRQPLYSAGVPIDFIYFLESGVASMVCTMTNGQAAEVGTIGNEGMVGLPVVFGDTLALQDVYVQVPGHGYAMPAEIFRQRLRASPSMQAIVLRYAHCIFNQVAQSAACAHFHPIEQRACRWLLMTHDRMLSKEFLLTQEFFAMMLGVRRQGVTKVASMLQHAGLIQYHRGHVTIVSRQGLEACACECYAVSKLDFDVMLAQPVIAQ